jgi:hypothetical protein
MTTRKEKEDKWIAQFDKEYPPISSKDSTTREYKIDFMRQRGKERYESYQSKQQAYKSRQQAYAEEKKQRRKAAYNRKENEYLPIIKDALGENWYKLVRNTQYDCSTAIFLRYEEEERAEEEDWKDAIRAQELEKKWEEERQEEKRKKKEYMDTLSPTDLKKYKKELRELAEEEDYSWECTSWDYSCRQVRALNNQVARNKRNEELWTAWLKINYPWDWSEMQKLVDS